MPFSKALYKLSFVIAPTIRFGSWYSTLHIVEKEKYSNSNYKNLPKRSASRIRSTFYQLNTTKTTKKDHPM